MCRSKYKSKRHKTVASIEPLDERVVLSIFVPAPPTPAPAAGPFNAAMVRRFELRIDRINRAFLTQSRQLNAMVSQRAARLEAILAQATQMAQAQVQQNAALMSGLTPQVIMVNQTQAINNQLASLVATSSARLNQLNTTIERRFGLFVAPFMQSDFRFNIPANAFENNLRAARFAFSTSLTRSVGSIASQVQNQVNSLTNVVNTSSTSPITVGTTGTRTTGTSTGTVGTVQTQTFNDFFTQAFSSVNAAIQSVNSTLAQNFGSLTTAFNNNVTSLMSTLNSTSPFGIFRPFSTFTPGTGVTFTSSTPITGTGTTGTTTFTNGTTSGVPKTTTTTIV
jgi:hypothetical protein